MQDYEEWKREVGEIATVCEVQTRHLWCRGMRPNEARKVLEKLYGETAAQR